MRACKQYKRGEISEYYYGYTGKLIAVSDLRKPSMPLGWYQPYSEIPLIDEKPEHILHIFYKALHIKINAF